MRSLLPIFLLLPLLSAAQINGGQNVYQFLNLSPSARITALGGHHIAVRDDDVAMGVVNPGILTEAVHGQFSFNHSFLFDGIQNGYFGYGHHVESWDATLHGGVQYVNYGEMTRTDVFQQEMGTFRPRELALVVGGSREVYERLTLGANVKYISSQFEQYQSRGMVADFGAVFHDTSRNFVATLVWRNVGGQFSQYRDGNAEDVPFELQAGISKRLRYLPFRFEIIYRYLNRFDIAYDDPDRRESTNLFGDAGEVDVEGPGNFDTFLRHFVFNGEFLFGKKENLRLRLGYNHLRQSELAIRNYRSLGGFTFGVGLKIKQFRVDFGHAVHHFAGSINHISIGTSLSEFGAGSRIVR